MDPIHSIHRLKKKKKTRLLLVIKRDYPVSTDNLLSFLKTIKIFTLINIVKN